MCSISARKITSSSAWTPLTYSGIANTIPGFNLSASNATADGAIFVLNDVHSTVAATVNSGTLSAGGTLDDRRGKQRDDRRHQYQFDHRLGRQPVHAGRFGDRLQRHDRVELCAGQHRSPRRSIRASAPATTAISTSRRSAMRRSTPRWTLRPLRIRPPSASCLPSTRSASTSRLQASWKAPSTPCSVPILPVKTPTPSRLSPPIRRSMRTVGSTLPRPIRRILPPTSAIRRWRFLSFRPSPPGPGVSVGATVSLNHVATDCRSLCHAGRHRQHQSHRYGGQRRSRYRKQRHRAYHLDGCHAGHQDRRRLHVRRRLQRHRRQHRPQHHRQ